jgi:hypothetical protein
MIFGPHFFLLIIFINYKVLVLILEPLLHQFFSPRLTQNQCMEKKRWYLNCLISFYLNKHFFLPFFDHIKIETKGNMKRNFVQKSRCPYSIGNIKKVRELEKIFHFILK